MSRQTYPYVEHVVVDGGSVDGTLELLEDCATSIANFRWCSEQDDGVYDAVNRGLGLARGGVVAYLNSDDRYFPWAVEAAVAALTQNQDVGLVYGDMANVDLATLRGRLFLHPPYHPVLTRRHGLIRQPTVFWKRAVTDTIGGFDTTFRHAADLDYWFRAAEHFKLLKIHEVLAWEGEHDDRLSVTGHSRSQEELAALRQRYSATGSRPRQISSGASAVRDAVWRRVLVVRLLAASSGASWYSRTAGELPRHTGELDIDKRRLALSQIPRVGAHFDGYVRVRGGRGG